MNDDFTIKTALNQVFGSLSSAVAGLLPKILTALAVVIIGWILAKVISRAVRLLFARLKVDDLLEKVGVTGLLRKLGLQEAPGVVLGKLLYNLILLMFIQSAADAVGLATVSGAISAFFSYLPNLLSALILFMIGMLLSQFAGGAVTRSARASGIEFAPILGRIASGAILFVVSLMAVTQLKIHTDVIRSVVLVVLAGGSLAFALSFGLGSRDVTRNLMAGFYARKLFQVGEPIETREASGTLAGISALNTVLEVEGRMVTLPNAVFMEQAVRQ